MRYGLQRMVLEPDNPFALSENETILPQILRQEGYRNYAIGKWHLGLYKWRYTPTYRGFDQFYGYYQGGEDYYSHSILNGYDLRNETKPNCGPDCSKVDIKSNGTYSTFLFTQEAERMLRNHNSSKPFYMYLAQQGVHSPTEAPQAYIDKFKHIKNIQRRTFAAQLYLVDESIKNITNTIKELGYLDNTLIIFTTDNGACQCNSECLDNGGCNWPYRSGKESQFNGGVKGISFISGKIVEKYKTNNFTVYNGLLHGVDWLPTIAGLLNISIENKTLPLDGFNQWNEIISNKTSKRNEILLNTIKDEVDSYIMGDWKYISGKVICAYDGWIPLPVTNDINYPSDECLPNKPNDYLFNLKDDPFEKVNLIDKYPEIVEIIKKKIQVYKDEAVDEYIYLFIYLFYLEILEYMILKLILLILVVFGHLGMVYED